LDIKLDESRLDDSGEDWAELEYAKLERFVEHRKEMAAFKHKNLDDDSHAMLIVAFEKAVAFEEVYTAKYNLADWQHKQKETAEGRQREQEQKREIDQTWETIYTSLIVLLIVAIFVSGWLSNHFHEGYFQKGWWKEAHENGLSGLGFIFVDRVRLIIRSGEYPKCSLSYVAQHYYKKPSNVQR